MLSKQGERESVGYLLDLVYNDLINPREEFMRIENPSPITFAKCVYSAAIERGYNSVISRNMIESFVRRRFGEEYFSLTKKALG